VTSLIALAAIAFVAYRALSPDERLKALRVALRFATRVAKYGRKELLPFEEALAARARFPLVTWSIVALNTIVVAGLLFGAGSRSDSATLISWGAGFGPRTTNGEWWRLLTAVFVHPSFFVLLVYSGVIFQLGSVLERLVGPILMLAIYVAAAAFGGLAAVASFPMRVTAGAGPGVAGLYGLLAAIVVIGRWKQSPLSIPAVALVRIAPGFFLVLLCAAAAEHGSGGIACLASFAIGGIGGAVLARELGCSIPPWRRTAAAFAASIAVAIITAVPLRGIVDVRPELTRLIGVERRTAQEFATASALCTKGRMTAAQLADVVEQSIIPTLEAEQVRVIEIKGVPAEDEHFVSDAREYLRLRSESWRLRVSGLRQQSAPADPDAMDPRSRMSFRTWAETRYQSTLRTLGKAESTERASLQSFNRLLP
jgi:rhomboid protease GluP